MARLTQAPMTPRRSVSNPDSSLTDLTRLLARLQQNILHTDAERERRLRSSEYERNKASVNLEYARTLLTKLERDALAVKIHTRRQEMQTDLNQKRDVLEQLAERLRELEELSFDSDEDDEDDSDQGEDLLSEIVETPTSGSWDSREANGNDGHPGAEEADEAEGESTILPEPRAGGSREDKRISEIPTQREEQAAPSPPVPASPTTTSQTLRPRNNNNNDATIAPAQQDKASTTALRNQLFGEKSTTITSSTSPAAATTEAIIDHHRAEQDQLTESMIAMARALKESTHKFSSSLQEDEEVMRSATSGLEQNERGLGAVAGRMGTLRRLTEGQGWWGRMLLYVWIAGLSVLAVLLVFVFPKLRF
ncbi:hypothetical protein F4778DRAFT_726246 [Xylariomycetidae sp. FL2044]|nr:hypothetical protein F4778DRAFT_726246 [Xylariomycetidae sp. FL2044]